MFLLMNFFLPTVFVEINLCCHLEHIREPLSPRPWGGVIYIVGISTPRQGGGNSEGVGSLHSARQLSGLGSPGPFWERWRT